MHLSGSPDRHWPPPFAAATNLRQKARAAGLHPDHWYAVEHDKRLTRGRVVEVRFWNRSIAIFRGRRAAIGGKTAVGILAIEDEPDRRFQAMRRHVVGRVHRTGRVRREQRAQRASAAQSLTGQRWRPSLKHQPPWIESRSCASRSASSPFSCAPSRNR